MKKIFTLCLLLVSLTTFSQDKDTKDLKSLIEQTKDASTLIGQAKEKVGEYVDYDAVLAEVTDIKGLFVHYAKQATEGTKGLVGSTIEVAEKVVTLLVEESTIIVKQFLVYTSITHLIPILFGIWLIFWLPRLIRKRFVIKTETAEAHNEKVDNYEGVYKPSKKLLLSGKYFNDKASMISNSVGTYIGYLCGLYLVFINAMPFIKVTFFSKLYLVELLLKYI